MTRSELALELARLHPELTRKNAELVVNTIFSTMCEGLIAGQDIEIRGFGSFRLKERDARTARNPRSGEAVWVPGKKVLAFRAAKELRERVDKTDEAG